jgi:hypothetical protein
MEGIYNFYIGTFTRPVPEFAPWREARKPTLAP